MIWILLGFLLICSGSVSACETALFRLSRRTLHKFLHSDRSGRRRVGELMLHPRRTLLTILITNTGVNVAFFAVSFMALGKLRETNATLGMAAGVGTLLLVIVFGEMLPKALTLSRAESLAPRAAALVTLLQTLLAPVRGLLAVLLVNPMTRLFEPAPSHPAEIGVEELQTLVEQSAHEGVISSSENRMLQAVVAMSDASVREVMTPRVDMESLSLSVSAVQTAKAFQNSAVSLFPVYGRDADDVLGLIHLRDVRLNPKQPARALLKKVEFVPEQANLLQVLRHFREKRIEAAIVVDEFGGTAGFVTIDDITDRTLGSVGGEQEPSGLPTTERIDDNTYRLSGDLSVREWAKRFGVVELDRHIDTVAGLILSKLGRVPHTGDHVQVGNLTLTVERMTNHRIERVLLQRDGTEMNAGSTGRCDRGAEMMADRGSGSTAGGRR